MINNTATAETKEMEMIVIGSKSPIRYLPMTEFLTYGEEFEDEEGD